MGWDAYSSVDKLKGDTKAKAKKAFIEAHKRVLKKCGEVDFYLHDGALDVSWSGHMLSQATNEPVYVDKPWDIEKVHKLRNKANWNFEYEKEQEWAYWSAREFLNVCAKYNLSITFSY